MPEPPPTCSRPPPPSKSSPPSAAAANGTANLSPDLLTRLTRALRRSPPPDPLATSLAARTRSAPTHRTRAQQPPDSQRADDRRADRQDPRQQYPHETRSARPGPSRDLRPPTPRPADHPPRRFVRRCCLCLHGYEGPKSEPHPELLHASRKARTRTSLLITVRDTPGVGGHRWAKHRVLYRLRNRWDCCRADPPGSASGKSPARSCTGRSSCRWASGC